MQTLRKCLLEDNGIGREVRERIRSNLWMQSFPRFSMSFGKQAGFYKQCSDLDYQERLGFAVLWC